MGRGKEWPVRAVWRLAKNRFRRGIFTSEYRLITPVFKNTDSGSIHLGDRSNFQFSIFNFQSLLLQGTAEAPVPSDAPPPAKVSPE